MKEIKDFFEKHQGRWYVDKDLGRISLCKVYVDKENPNLGIYENKRSRIWVRPRRSPGDGFIGWTDEPVVGDVLEKFMFSGGCAHRSFKTSRPAIVIGTRENSSSGGGRFAFGGGGDMYPGYRDFIVQELKKDGTFDKDGKIIACNMGGGGISGIEVVKVIGQLKQVFI